MEIWIIQDGEKAGPFHDFEIRKKIEDGELDADTLAWHERLNGWQPLSNIELFRRELTEPSPPPIPAEELNIPQNPYLIRRFCARWLDLYFFSGVLWLTLWFTDCNIGKLIEEPLVVLLQYVPWFAIEVYLIHRFATTPGKWLLNLKVINLNGSKLEVSASIHRAIRVLCIGIGFGLVGITLVCQTLAWITTKKLGRTLWDRAGGHTLDATPLQPAKIFLFIAIFLFSIWLQWIVLAPYIIENMESMEKKFPALYEHANMKANPPWHLPKK